MPTIELNAANQENTKADVLSPSAQLARLQTHFRAIDLLCAGALSLLWLLFFWRILTLSAANAIHLREGDFSGQFVAWAAYQARELAHRHFPLWNPFSNAGHPFLADTQSAVFYPLRVALLGIMNGLAAANGAEVTAGAVYQALQWEAALQVLILSLTMYAFVRRLIQGEGRFLGGMVAALTFAYSGFVTGYPLLQLAVLGAVTWAPLLLLGVLEATRDQGRLRWGWFLVSGTALGLSFHAGSPQFTHWSILIAFGFLAVRVYQARLSWRAWLIGAVLIGVVGGGLAAVQLLPGLQFYAASARRANFTFDGQGNGFPPSDLIQFVLPGWLTQWSPLYVGLAGVCFAALAVWRRVEGSLFWGGLALVALILSFGGNTILWDVAYNLPIGFSLFREQERAAFPVTIALAVLAGLGAAHFRQVLSLPRMLAVAFLAVAAGMLALATVFFLAWQFNGNGDTRAHLTAWSTVLAAGLIAGAFGVTRPGFRAWLGSRTVPWLALGIVAFMVLDLFTFGRHVDNYQPGAAAAELPLPPQISLVQADTAGVYRVDGQRGVLENYGALYSVQDIRGTSPLRLDRYEKLLRLPQSRLWEVLAVRYVFTPDQELPVPSQIVGTGADGYGPVNVHRLSDPRPFARLVTRTWIVSDDQSELDALANPDLDIRNTVVLPSDPGLNLPGAPPADLSASVVQFAPEAVTIQTQASSAAILDLSIVYYPGWEAQVDGTSVPVLRSNLALLAVPLPPGSHTVTLRLRSVPYEIGSVISGATLAALILMAGYGAFILVRSARKGGVFRGRSSHGTTGQN